MLLKGFNKILTLTVYFVNLSTFFHLGLTLINRSPQISCPGFFLKKLVLEHLSAIIFSLDGIHRVLTFILAFNMCKCAPCAHRSNGYRGQRADWNHACALVLSSSRYVSIPAHSSTKVSVDMSAAINSATLICTSPGDRPGNSLTRIHCSHEHCQNTPPYPGYFKLG